MSDRDELSDIVSDNTDWADVRSGSNNAADAIIEAGYRKPRLITTPEELQALPAGSVVVEDINRLDWMDVYFKAPDVGGHLCWFSGDEEISFNLPVTAVHIQQESADV